MQTRADNQSQHADNKGKANVANNALERQQVGFANTAVFTPHLAWLNETERTLASRGRLSTDSWQARELLANRIGTLPNMRTLLCGQCATC